MFRRLADALPADLLPALLVSHLELIVLLSLGSLNWHNSVPSSSMPTCAVGEGVLDLNGFRSQP